MDILKPILTLDGGYYYFLFHEVSVYIVGVWYLVYLYRKEIRDDDTKWLGIYLLAFITSQIIATITSDYGINNMFLWHLYPVARFSILGLFFTLWEARIRTVYLCSIIYLIYLSLSTEWDGLDEKIFIFEAAAFIVMAIFVYSKNMNYAFARTFKFWFAFSQLILFVPSLFLYHVLFSEQSAIYWSINSIINITSNVFLLFAMEVKGWNY